MNEVKRPSLREAARRGADANRQTKAAAPPPKSTPAPTKRVEAVKATASCGHEIDVGPCKPAFIAERQKKLAALPCPECKRKAQQEREAAEQEAARQREEKAAAPPRPKPRLSRLPHGSTFRVVYDAEAVKWSGALTVPQGGIYNGSVTTGEDSAVFALLMQLDRTYRKLPAEEGRRPRRRRPTPESSLPCLFTLPAPQSQRREGQARQQQTRRLRGGGRRRRRRRGGRPLGDGGQ